MKRAQAEAESIKIRAAAESEAIRLRGDAIAEAAKAIADVESKNQNPHAQEMSKRRLQVQIAKALGDKTIMFLPTSNGDDFTQGMFGGMGRRMGKNLELGETVGGGN